MGKGAIRVLSAWAKSRSAFAHVAMLRQAICPPYSYSAVALLPSDE
jgi:hypothetical protein